jgi:23S rRNA (uridine2552-2'-O)-methyltransferase
LSRWIHERKNDHFHQRAKEEGYRSRSAYKLKQIDNKFRIFDDARYVLDLGAAPGGWLQVASEKIDPEGLVIGIDLEEIEPLWAENVATLQGDIRTLETRDDILNIYNGKFDVVLSDMAPDVTGQWDLDQYRQIYLARIALQIAYDMLKPNGWLVVKIFQGGEHIRYIRQVKRVFHYVKNFKPKASRKGSAERYVIANRIKKSARRPRLSFDRQFEEEEDDYIPGDQLLFEEEGQ